MKRRFFETAMLVFVTAFAILSCDADATILVFDPVRSTIPPYRVIAVPLMGDVLQDYGDRVTGNTMNVAVGRFTYGSGGEGFTPNVTTDYFQSTSTEVAPRGISTNSAPHGDLTNVLLGDNGSSTLNIRLSADSGFMAMLYHFDLAGWQTGDNTIKAVSVMDGSRVIFSRENVLVEGTARISGHTSFDFPVPLSSAEITIIIDYSNQDSEMQDGFGVDNVTFGQAPEPVPEPATFVMFVCGICAVSIVHAIRL